MSQESAKLNQNAPSTIVTTKMKASEHIGESTLDIDQSGSMILVQDATRNSSEQIIMDETDQMQPPIDDSS